MRKDIRIRISSGNLVPLLLKLELEQRPGALARHRRPDDRVLLGRQTLWRQRDGPPRDRDREPLAAVPGPAPRPTPVSTPGPRKRGAESRGREKARERGRSPRRASQATERGRATGAAGKGAAFGPSISSLRPNVEARGLHERWGPALRSPGPDQISRFHGFYVPWDLRTTTKRLLTCR